MSTNNFKLIGGYQGIVKSDPLCGICGKTYITTCKLASWHFSYARGFTMNRTQSDGKVPRTCRERVIHVTEWH